MKKIFLLALCALVAAGCNKKEDKLRPTEGISMAGKFAFPQEGTPADVQAVLDQIYETYGVKVIWKDFTEKDFQRSWTSPQQTGGSITYAWDMLSGADLLTAAEMFRDKVLGLLPVEVVKAGTTSMPYIYLVDNLTENGEVVATYPKRALDAMVVNLQIHADADNYRHKIFFPLSAAMAIFNEAYYYGAVTMPDEFFERYTTTTRDRMKSYKHATGDQYGNYWARQGTIPLTDKRTGRLFIGKATGTRILSEISPMTGTLVEVPYYFLMLSADTHWQEHDDVLGVMDGTLDGVFYDCPTLMGRLQQFNDQMKAQGIDFDQIRTKLYAGTSVNKSKTHIYVNGVTPDDIDKYYYYDLNSN